MSEIQKTPRLWYQKKRFIFPLIAVILLVVLIAATPRPSVDTAKQNAETKTAVQDAGKALTDLSKTIAPKEDDKTKNMTVSQKNAVAKAKSYLDISGFSRDGLVTQLKFEKFSEADAIYGVDNVGADWNEQAAKKAKSYLDMMAYSRDGLITQLKFEKFTQAQAEYGAKQVGL